ncbi:hypothetical protein BGZ80_007618 [Entomortierella chlamydospora]|uniref:N-acetyltransferase domain-containing protein n=1 Tax=Entomortierella chlamydospora TaxID=101097 RepID=A0A9P6SRT1_9FUNG|nr:hypothetical protein BGZ80_007618 [Entomortierella chlamydospora]KAF9996616.1 hypothetical protein BGZ79_009651 [Entomortierella chlamydospora]
MPADIDRSAILIRPYNRDDYDQVSSILIQGFKSVNGRFFSSKASHYTTFLSIFIRSTVYTILVEIALTAYFNLQSSDSNYFSLEDLRSLYTVLTQDESAQSLILRFLQPSLLIVWVIVSLATGVSTVLGIYRWAISTGDDYIESAFKDDLGDIEGYYQSTSSTNQKPNRSQFWVACLKDYPEIVMGCIALDDVSAHAESFKKKHLQGGGKESTFEAPKKTDAELRRLSVHPNYRRLGISRMLTEKLVAHAKENKFDRVYFMTTIYQTAALAGYIRFGFDKEKMLTYGDFVKIWCGTLNLNATKEEKEELRRKQESLLAEVGAK